MTPASDAWVSEPELVDEKRFSTFGKPGWRAWNAMSPEYEFCELVGSLVRMIRPGLVVESGVGQGFTTRRIGAALPDASRLLAFESDVRWRERLAALPFFDGEQVVLSAAPSPSDDDLAAADLFVADSGSNLRPGEVERWSKLAKPGAYIVVHDTGNGHWEGTPHHRLGKLIESLGIAGVRLPNPRGSFVGQQI